MQVIREVDDIKFNYLVLTLRVRHQAEHLTKSFEIREAILKEKVKYS